MRKSALLVGLTCASLLAIAPAASGVTHAPQKQKQFKSSVSPAKGVKSGTKLTVRGTGAEKNTAYYCVLLIAQKPAKAGAQVVNTNSVVTSMSNASGKVTCHETFKPFSGKYKGRTYHCPTTSADRKHHFSCAAGFADVPTQGKSSASEAFFKAKK
jgi:hypothetical protein